MADRITNKSVTVGTTPVVLAQELLTGQRKFISIVNTSTAGQKISISINQDPTAGVGIVLSPGGSYSDSQDGTTYYPSHYNFTAVADGAGGAVAITERIGREVDY